jgi:hypothetical protein
MALVNRAFAEEEARKEAFGVAAVKRQHRALNNAEEGALGAICAYVCPSPEESRLKGEYLTHMHKLTGGLQSWHLEALLASWRGDTVIWDP